MTDNDRATADAATTRRMRRTAMLTAIIAIAPLWVIGVILTAPTWWDGVIGVASLLFFLTVFREWNLDGYPLRIVLVLLFTGGVWLLAALTMTGPMGFVPFAVLCALLLARLTNHRLLVTVACALGSGLIGAAVLVFHDVSVALVDGYILLPVAGTLFVAGVVSVSERSWQLVIRLERAREAEAELALAHERMRFAGDLHDIQGHTLHVIKLKTALAQRLVATDPLKANAELTEIRGLVDDTIRKTRELAYARYEIEFAAELENARRLAEAAGIDVEVRQDPALAAVHPLLAHLLREATTNLLRHASPTHVTITVSAGRVEIENDGAADGGAAELRGLARLRERIELAGGELHTAQTPGSFTVWATLDAATGTSTPSIATRRESR